jgi:hypothetical protein
MTIATKENTEGKSAPALPPGARAIASQRAQRITEGTPAARPHERMADWIRRPDRRRALVRLELQGWPRLVVTGLMQDRPSSP